MQITRREFCQSTAALTLATAVVGISSLPSFEALAAETVPAGELMKPDALPEMIMIPPAGRALHPGSDGRQRPEHGPLSLDFC